MKSNWRKRIGNLLLVSGCALILYLAVSQYLMDQREQELIGQLEAMSETAVELAQREAPTDQENEGWVSAKRTSLSTDKATNNQPAAPPSTTTPPPPKTPTPKHPTAIALLNIPKINLRVPVAEGSAPDTLNYAVGHLEYTGQLGVTGANFAIVGHRSNAWGRFFNRLDELAVQDEFVLTAGQKTYTYRVVEKRIIEPTQVEVLHPVPDVSRVTLITCHPQYSDRQRLVVTAELKQSKE